MKYLGLVCFFIYILKYWREHHEIHVVEETGTLGLFLLMIWGFRFPATIFGLRVYLGCEDWLHTVTGQEVWEVADMQHSSHHQLFFVS